MEPDIAVLNEPEMRVVPAMSRDAVGKFPDPIPTFPSNLADKSSVILNAGNWLLFSARKDVDVLVTPAPLVCNLAPAEVEVNPN